MTILAFAIPAAPAWIEISTADLVRSWSCTGPTGCRAQIWVSPDGIASGPALLPLQQNASELTEEASCFAQWRPLGPTTPTSPTPPQPTAVTLQAGEAPAGGLLRIPIAASPAWTDVRTLDPNRTIILVDGTSAATIWGSVDGVTSGPQLTEIRGDTEATIVSPVRFVQWRREGSFSVPSQVVMSARPAISGSVPVVPGANLVFRPGEPSGLGHVATWAEVKAAIPFMSPGSWVVCDSSLAACVVPASTGETDMLQTIGIMSYRQSAPGATLLIEDGATLFQPAGIKNACRLNGQCLTTPALRLTGGQVFTIAEDSTLAFVGAAAVPFCDAVPTATFIKLFDQGRLSNSTSPLVPILNLAAGASIIIEDFISITALGISMVDTIAGPVGTVVFWIGDASSIRPTFVGLLGTLTGSKIDTAAGTRYTDSAPLLGATDVQAAIDALKVQSGAPGMFGDGSDGDVVPLAGVTTLTRTMYYRNLTLLAGCSINTAGFPVFVSDSCDTDIASAFSNDGTSGTSAGLPGVGGLCFGASGSDGGDGAPAALDPNAIQSTPQIGGSGGVGGASANPSGTPAVNNAIGPRDLISATTLLTDSGAGVPQCGGGGGAGGFDGVNPGGGGGGGGGPVYLAARRLNHRGIITSRGGDGGTPLAGNAGGGGGAGGGFVWIVAQQRTGIGLFIATGGALGVGIGTGLSGAPGDDGTALVFT